MGETNVDNNRNLLLKECLVLLDKYNNCLAVMSDNCKCGENIENKLLFRDLLAKYRSIITNNKTFIENITTLERSYGKCSEYLCNLSANEPITGDNETIDELNESIVAFKCEPDYNELENGNNSIGLIDCKANVRDLTETTQIISEQNIDVNITKTFNGNFEYISNNYLTNNPNLNHVVIANEAFECDKCQQTIRIVDRVSHNRSAHNLFVCEKLFNGNVCGIVYSRLCDFTRHVERAHCMPKPFKCSECGKDYPLLKQLYAHQKKYHKQTKTLFACDWKDCDFTSYNEKLVDMHRKSHSPPKIQTIVYAKNFDKRYKCGDCDKEYKIPQSLEKHRYQVHRQHKHVCDWNDCKYSTPYPTRLLTHQKRHLKIKTFHCDWPGCGSSFVDKWDLRTHSSRHSDTTFRCPHCDRLLKTRCGLREHIKVTHNDAKPYECDRCERKYALKSRLTEHVRSAHSEKKFKCDNCDYKSNFKYLVAKHNTRVHLREKTYACDANGCDGKSFFCNSDLLAHQMSVHSDARKFVCDWPDCGAAFKLKNNLYVHSKKCHSGTNVSRKTKTKLKK